MTAGWIPYLNPESSVTKREIKCVTLRFVEIFLACPKGHPAHFLKYREDPGNEVG